MGRWRRGYRPRSQQPWTRAEREQFDAVIRGRRRCLAEDLCNLQQPAATCSSGPRAGEDDGKDSR